MTSGPLFARLARSASKAPRCARRGQTSPKGRGKSTVLKPPLNVIALWWYKVSDVSRLPQDLRELYGLRERLREQFHTGKGNKLQICLAIVEVAQRITALEDSQSFTDRIIAASDQLLES